MNMSSRWRIGLVTIGLAGALTTGLPATAGQAPAAVPRDTMAEVAAMQPGWNAGNSLDAIPDETSWGNPAITKQLFDTVRSLGFHSVRIPVTWGIHEGAAPDYTIDPAFLGRVRQVVDWALADGLYVILDVHHDSWQWISNMPADPTGVLAQYTATWTQIAAEFRDESGKLVLESVNEPQFTNATDTRAAQLLDELNTTFYHLVRNSGGGNATRLLLLPTQGDTPTQALMDNLAGTIQSLHDSRLIASVHYYGYWPFAVNIAGYTTFDATVQQDITTTFGLLHSEFIAKGIPVYAGEIGLLNYDYTRPGIIERGELLKYFEALGYAARVNGVTTSMWDTGLFINRVTFQLRDPGVFAQIASSWFTRSGTAATDQIFLPESGAITDQTVTLNLNGTTFRGLSQGLVEGRDYTVSGDQLTLPAATLTRLAGNRAYGVDATLEVMFSQGVPWQLNVLSYGSPVLSNAAGTTTSFAIPAQFLGDQLATMTATYADGSAAGQANWTPYQEFWTSFIPDYTSNVISLTPDFLASLDDGAPVTLVFHFWSGATATYQVTRSGSTVTGISG